MAITLTATAQRPDAARADLLVVPAGPDGPIGSAAAVLSRAFGDDLAAVSRTGGFEGKPGQTVLVPSGGRLGAAAVLVVGVGDPADLTLDGIRRAGATLARSSAKVRVVATTLLDAAPRALGQEAAAQALAEGVLLGAYQFLEYKSHGTPSALRRVAVLDGRADVKRGLTRGDLVAHAAIWARDMVNEPAGAKSPAEFAAAARRLLVRTGVTVQVLTEPQIRAQRLGGLLGVGQGSERPPRFLRVSYAPTGRANGSLALVGKGVVFDSGGLSLKPPGGMETMKTDMSGAASVVATMSVLRRLGVRARVTAYVPLVENMPSGTAIRPGDVLTIRNGKTVEVLNTDAEGRLILADALSLAVEDRADAIVDLATLTGACVVALGEKIAGLMGNHDGWSEQVREAGDRAGEPLWPLPLPTDYRKQLDSEVADLRNIGTGSYGGALTAGIFLEQFVGDRPWVHLDIAGPSAAPSDDGYLVKGGTGFGVRTLIELVSRFEVPEGAVARTNGSAAPPKARSGHPEGDHPDGEDRDGEECTAVTTKARRFGSVLAVGSVAVLAAAGVFAAAPAGADTAAQTSGKATVTVGDNYFKAEDLEVTAGTKVTWVNKGKILHTVTPDQGKAYGTRALNPKKKYSYTFKKPGEYAYHCSLHGAPGSGQHGTIIVKAAPPPTTTTSGP